MKILVLAPQPFFRVRGTPINIRNLVTSMVMAGHEVDLLCYPFGEAVELQGVRILRSPGFPGIKDVKVGPSAAKFPLDGLMFLKATGLCLKHKYDVIHAVEESVFFAVFLRWIKRPRLIYDMDSCISDQLRYSGFVKSDFVIRRIEGLERWAIRRSAFVLTVCQSLSDTVRNLVPNAKIVQIEDAPQDDEFVEDPEGAGKLRETFGLGDHRVVLYTGNFESYQGVEGLVRAAADVVPHCPDVRFVLVGGEPAQVEAMNALAAALGIAEACCIPGKRPPEEMTAFMTMAELLVSPRTEGTNTALKIYGYMQSGRAVVATEMETHTQVLDGKCSYLVPPNAEGIASGIRDALDHPDEARARGLLAKQLVDTEFSLPAFRRKVAEAYEDLG